MATLTKELLSGSTDGQGIKVVAVATAGTLAHTAHATAKDEIHLWLTNTDTVDREVTVEFGGPAVDQNLKFVVPAKETIYAVPGLVLTNTKTVKVFAAAANVVNMAGYVNRYA